MRSLQLFLVLSYTRYSFHEYYLMLQRLAYTEVVVSFKQFYYLADISCKPFTYISETTSHKSCLLRRDYILILLKCLHHGLLLLQSMTPSLCIRGYSSYHSTISSQYI
jgi:hypothetical protein